jgi:hypothetical protein
MTARLISPAVFLLPFVKVVHRLSRTDSTEASGYTEHWYSVFCWENHLLFLQYIDLAGKLRDPEVKGCADTLLVVLPYFQYADEDLAVFYTADVITLGRGRIAVGVGVNGDELQAVRLGRRFLCREVMRAVLDGGKAIFIYAAPEDLEPYEALDVILADRHPNNGAFDVLAAVFVVKA